MSDINELNFEEMNQVAGGARPQEKAGFFIYQIVKGDTLGKIAKRFGTTVDKLLAANPKIKNRNLIYAGDYIYVNQ